MIPAMTTQCAGDPVFIRPLHGELYGRPLNVAARLEALAEPGGIYVSGAVFDRVGGLGPARFEPLGERRLDKISTPRRVYRVDRASCPDGPL
jgi:adenylate cyclase